MNLGEKIYKLRTERNLSQGDLAEMLEVSRQSISKWETNGSVPDLDKIIKLSSIFDVTLDELVLGKKKCECVDEPDVWRSAARISDVHQEGYKLSTEQNDTQGQGFPPRKIAGTILLCMAFLVVLVCSVIGGFLEGLIFSLPFVACGIVCFACKKNVGLWCGWTVFAIGDVASRYMTGYPWSVAWRTIYRFLRYGSEIKLNLTIILIVSLLAFLALLTLIVVTVVRFSRNPGSTSKRTLYSILAGWVVFIVLNIPMPWLQWMIEWKMYVVYYICAIIYQWVRVVLFTILATKSVQYIRSIKCSK